MRLKFRWITLKLHLTTWKINLEGKEMQKSIVKTNETSDDIEKALPQVHPQTHPKVCP